MRALEHDAPVTQIHLNRRRFFQFFTSTNGTGSRCLVEFQIISEHFQSISRDTHQQLTPFQIRIKAQFPLTPTRHSTRSQNMTTKV